MCCDSWGHKESDTTERLNYYYIRLVLWLKKKKIALKKTNTMSLVHHRNLRHLKLNERSQTQRHHIVRFHLGVMFCKRNL